MGLLPGGLLGSRGYLGCEDFMAYGTGHNSNVRVRSYLGAMVLCAAALAVLLVIDGVE